MTKRFLLSGVIVVGMLAACGGGAGGGATPPTGGGATPTPAVTATPSATPSASATASATPTPTPTASPSSGATPNASAYGCNNAGWVADQTGYANGALNKSTDSLVDVCGYVEAVTQTVTTTSSGPHGYFWVTMTNGYNIQILSNLSAMSQASTDKPPTTWPWVTVGQYVYVQGRYYYDSASSQGIDWTEDDTGSWPNVGWVYVCDPTAVTCNKYW